MDEKLKENLNKALNSGKDALNNLQGIIKNITKEAMEKSKKEGQDVKASAQNLFKEIINALGVLGKDTKNYLAAALKGVKEGLKESSTPENNLVKALGSSLLDSIKNLGEAGVFVTKETAKNLASLIDDFFKKNKDTDKQEDKNDEQKQ
jgi:ElaB/YqjD/DUF883 family membrane-anchored ribosome-binding protein